MPHGRPLSPVIRQLVSTGVTCCLCVLIAILGLLALVRWLPERVHDRFRFLWERGFLP